MFIDASGNVSVVNVNDGYFPYVDTYNSGGSLQTSFSNIASFDPMKISQGVTRDAAGNYYVSNVSSSAFAGNISKWDSSGTLVNGAYITTGANAYGMLVDGSTLFVASYDTWSILYYDLANSGNYLGEISVGANPTYMNFATTAVPEPGTWAAAALLAGGAAFMRWRKRAKVA